MATKKQIKGFPGWHVLFSGEVESYYAPIVVLAVHPETRILDEASSENYWRVVVETEAEADEILRVFNETDKPRVKRVT